MPASSWSSSVPAAATPSSSPPRDWPRQHKYRVDLQSSGKTITGTSAELARGIDLRLGAARDAELAIYHAEP